MNGLYLGVLGELGGSSLLFAALAPTLRVKAIGCRIPIDRDFMKRTSKAPVRSVEPKPAKSGGRRAVIAINAAGPSKLARALHALAQDLPNPSDESTDFFRSFVAPLSPKTPLTGAAVQAALKIGSRYEIDLSPADATFTRAGNPDNSGQEIAGGFRLLEQVMRASLSDLSVAFARAPGVVRVRMFLFGRFEDGTLVGLRSISTET